MGSQTHLVTAMDTGDRLPFDPTIRIPPIQDPSPLQVVPSHRLSPLEPSAAEGNRPSGLRLSSREKALATAQPLGNDSPLRPLDSSRIGNSRRASQSDGSELGPRKRQRVDYVQLPQPHKPNALERNNSLDAIPRVNQLHEPPPSAARFPPITTNAGSPHIGKSHPRNIARKSSSTGVAPSQLADDSPVSSEEPKKAKRNYTRGRRMWTEEETENLLKGVARYGVGKWKRILNDPELPFPSDRTAVDLKDRYRTCRMHEERKIERHANGDPYPDETSAASPLPKAQAKSRKSTPPKAPEVPKETPSPAVPRLNGKGKKRQKEEPKNDEEDQQQPGINFATVNTVEDMAEELAKKAEPTPPKWTAEDDQNLSRGFQKYGFHWTAISKDPELSLQGRTGPQLRDRFRVKFPIHYQSSVPIELPEPAAGYDRDQRPRRRLAPKGGTKVALSKKDRSKDASKGDDAASSGQRSKNMSIADIIKPAGAAQTPKITKTSLPSMSSLCAQVDAQPLPDPATNNGPLFDIQPLPEEGEDFDESDFDEGLTEYDDDGERSPDGDQSGNEEDENDRSRDDVRHLGILGLLNEPEVEGTVGNRLPPFKSTYDELHEDWGQSSVTLPPLLLEAPRPMFELD